MNGRLVLAAFGIAIVGALIQQRGPTMRYLKITRM
jgi:hypothetical protein